MRQYGSDTSRHKRKQISIPFATYTATKEGTARDCSGAGTAVEINILTGTLANASAANTMTFKITQSATESGSYTDADTAQYDKINSWNGLIDDNSVSDTFYSIVFLLKPGYRWLKIVATEAGTFNDPFCGWIEFIDMTQPVIST
jgi:hypothetical protein